MSELDDLRKTPLFAGFTEEERRALVAGALVHSVPAGEIVCREGAPNSSLWIIRSGEIQVCRVLRDEEVHLSDLAPGESFGEMSVIEGGTASATLRAGPDSVVLEIPKEQLEETLAKDPVLAARFWRAVATQLRHRLQATSDSVVNYVDISRSLVENPNFREFWALCHR